MSARLLSSPTAALLDTGTSLPAFSLSQKDCETAAGELGRVRQRDGTPLKCSHYHAALDTKVRRSIQERWSAGDIQVIW